MEKGRWKRKVEEEDEDKDEEMKMKWNSRPILDSNGSNRVLDQLDSTLSNDLIQ
ncbi:hypothetical protein JCGZ_08910 [Jatropha curcas]|uniref:Uncharacterized protein n=1 Tax=Jatropha curcas TaxID=180498 RepID=A0A067LEV4_JATCU|nr:hypothetical protein JCGZ_08910 [Jatropha curcas]